MRATLTAIATITFIIVFTITTAQAEFYLTMCKKNDGKYRLVSSELQCDPEKEEVVGWKAIDADDVYNITSNSFELYVNHKNKVSCEIENENGDPVPTSRVLHTYRVRCGNGAAWHTIESYPMYIWAGCIDITSGDIDIPPAYIGVTCTFD